MTSESSALHAPSRRQFIATTGAALAAVALPGLTSYAQQPPPVKYRRLNLLNPAAPLDSYREAISKMLTLPPTDPRNWYRHALIHTLDCPHGNWWFLPWHRGYIGWFEKICRELSGNPDFALPYWDWTTLPRIPDAFYDGLLTPTNPAFVASLEEFEQQFRNPVSDLWKSFTPAQVEQLSARAYNDAKDTYRTPDDLWKSIEGAPPAVPPMFFPLKQARALTKSFPCFDPGTRIAVSAATVRTALAAPTFVKFGSGIRTQHSESGDQGILESQPHNLVHNNVGSFMSDLLSPVDPIFFMHHSNIDRLWEVWNRRQKALGQPTLPTDPTELANWKKESFLFYVTEKGQPVTKTTSGDYIDIGDFAYDYQPGSNEEPPPKPTPFANKLWASTLSVKSASFLQSARSEVTLPDALPAAVAKPDGAPLFARITLQAGVETKDVQFYVLVNPPAGATSVSFDDPSFAGSFSVFGRHTSAHGGQPLTFTVALTEAVSKLVAAKRFDPTAKVQVQVVAARRGASLAPLDLSVVDIAVGAF